MLLLITGASGAGKTTVREGLAPEFAAVLECVELAHLVEFPAVLTKAWRQQGADRAVQRAIALQAEGRHVLLAGDPVAAVEVAAAPSADRLDGFAVCLLDVAADVQARRLARRGDPAELVPHHQNFAAWMRRQAADPLYKTEVVTQNSWVDMRWERLPELAPSWRVHTVDTSDATPEQVLAATKSWVDDVIAGTVPAMTVSRSSAD